MRILFVAAPFRSHLYVQTPLAWALRTAGHDVRIAASPDLADDIAHSGLTGVTIGPLVSLSAHMAASAPAPDDAPAAPAPPESATAAGPVPPRAKSHQSQYPLGDPVAEMASNVRGWRGMFNPDEAFHDLVRFARLWRPDLIVSDTFTFTGSVAARVTGAAHARILFGADGLGQLRKACHEFWAHWRDDPAAPPPPADPLREWLEPILRGYGQEFDEDAVLGQWTLFPMPPWIHRPAGVSYIPLRHVPFNGPSTTPPWAYEPPTRRRVCITLGLAHREGGFGHSASTRDLLDAVADLDIEVVATFTQDQLEPGQRIPDNVRVADFVPLNVLLPTCSALVHSGGAGAFAAALEHGVPQLIVPTMYWSEKWWGPVAMANGLEERGAGVYVADADQLTAKELRDHLVRVLDEAEFTENAARLRTEMIAMPSPNDIVPVLEKLTAEHWGTPR
ncbi:activator-dependent family glycosyltransferase [Streptomyces griseus]|uniref:activator-dependent family glycosyltransferase n=1 Tax=Streptomyces griseus TaxID=1911 RepID=UPI00380BF76B